MSDVWNNPWHQSAPEKPSWLTDDIERALIAENMPLTQDGMLMLWGYWKLNLQTAKDLEMEYRKVCASFLTPTKPEGTTNVELGNGYVAKVVNKYNYNLASDNDKVWSALDKIAKVGNQGAFIAERLVSWHPSFLKTEYVTLQEEAEKGSLEAKQILEIVNSEMITITDAAPTLDIKPPKAKK